MKKIARLLASAGFFSRNNKTHSLDQDMYVKSGLFDANWYLSVNEDVRARGLDPLQHYQQFGWREMRDPSLHFSIWTYLTLYPRVRELGIDPLKHFILFGAREYRIPNPAFDPTWYAQEYMRTSVSSLTPLEHFLAVGGENNYWPHPLFDPKWYAASIGRPAITATEAYLHFLRRGCLANPNGFFDNNYYLGENADVTKSGLSPITHYYLFGGFEGRNPSEVFQSQWYLKTNPDVANRGINPLRHYLHKGQHEGRLTRPPSTLSAKGLFSELASFRLASFMRSDAYIAFPTNDAKPDVTVVIVLYNRANLSFECVDSLCKVAHASPDLNIETILFDNGSSDETEQWLKRLRGVKIVRSPDNIGYLRAVNHCAAHARGKYLLLLNNDTQVMYGSIEAAHRVIDRDATIGAVGGLLVLPDGTVQEAGCTISKDGGCAGYGRGLALSDPEVMFRRPVDYCSGAFLMTRTDLFRSIGGFDEAYAPAYYEDTDYCVNLWKNNYKVVYEPTAAVIHFEFGSATRKWAEEQQLKNRQLFVRKHGAYLETRYAPDQANSPAARFSVRPRHRILLIDDCVPFPWKGQGLPRSKALLDSVVAQFAETGQIFLCLTNKGDLDWTEIRKVVDPRVELRITDGCEKIALALAEFCPDVTIVSRPHNMRMFNAALDDHPEAAGSSKIIYDAEALFAVREARKQKLYGHPLSDSQVDSLLREETAVAQRAEIILAASSMEGAIFQQRSSKPTFVIGHAVNSRLTAASFDQRSGFLFVGAIHADDAPNADALLWFFENVWPIIVSRLGTSALLKIAGRNFSEEVAAQCPSGVELLGPVPDLQPLYEEARVFIAPTRFSAGIPLKVLEASGAGLPCVITEQLREQLGWRSGHEALVGSDAEEFAERCINLYQDHQLWTSVREAAHQSVQLGYDVSAFRRTVGLALAQVIEHTDTGQVSRDAPHVL